MYKFLSTKLSLAELAITSIGDPYDYEELSMGQTYLKPDTLIENFSYEHNQECQGEKDPKSYYAASSFFLSPITSNDSGAEHGSQNQGFIDDQLELKERFSPLLSLPLEVLHQIIELVYYDDNTNSISSNLENFSNTLPLLSKTLHQLSLRFLYKYAIFNRPHSFDKFLRALLDSPGLGNYVEFIDFQTFTSIGLGRTGRMNQEIQMVTSNTIRHTLDLTPNLLEFLASENIQDDMDVGVLDALFNRLPRIQALDFCGASSSSFAEALQQLEINALIEEVNDDNSVSYHHSLDNLFKVSFHDCSNVSPDVFIKLLPHFVNIRRLDLNHTSITSSILRNYAPTTARITHLSLARCSKLTTKDLINFLVSHPSVANESLEWLNLQIDFNVVSPLSDTYLLYTMKYLKAPHLKYLNLSGMPANKRVLFVIKQRFPELESLSIGHAALEPQDINTLLEDSRIKYLDITGIKSFSRWQLSTFLQTNFDSQLEAIEFDYKTLYELTAGESIKVTPVQLTFVETTPIPAVWKFYDNQGRRAWLYKLTPDDPEYESIIMGRRGKSNMASNLTYYDLETGRKIVAKVSQPKFLKYASKKVNCSIGYFNLKQAKNKRYIKNELKESTWPPTFSQRGIYNYYSLNVR